MTKEKIIEIVNACVQYNANQGTWSIDNRFADELLALMEQEKREVAREIFEKLLNVKIQQGPIYVSKNFVDLAKEYGVEL